MSEMVERVARAICKAQNQTDRKWQEFLPEATSAIEAMREPTYAMAEAGEDSEKVGFAADSAPAELVWKVMVDAALRSKNDGND